MNCSIKLNTVLDIRASTKDKRKRHDPFVDLELSGQMYDPETWVLARFMAMVQRTDGCWIWTGARNQFGYGMFSVEHRARPAHRWSYEYFIGEIPTGLECLHTCDFRNCVNPDHLWVGTSKDNIHDMCRKKRHRSMAKAPHKTGQSVIRDTVTTRLLTRAERELIAEYRRHQHALFPTRRKGKSAA